MHSVFARCWRSAWTPRRSMVFSRSAVGFSTASTYIMRMPPSSAPREVPTPLVFVSAGAWDEDSHKGMTLFSAMLAEKGFTCIQTDLVIPDSSKVNSETMMGDYQSELKSTIRLSTIPFPPVIFARSAACLIAQKYISSNPASAMCLIAPPASNMELQGSLLPSNLTEFNFEPKFPIAVMGTPSQIDHLKQTNRLCQDENVELIIVDCLESQQALIKIEMWLDKLGI